MTHEGLLARQSVPGDGDIDWSRAPIARLARTLRVRAEKARPKVGEVSLHILSNRELQIFLRIARGVSPNAMADELGLSVKTVSTYRARIMDKLGLRSTAEIVHYARTHGITMT